VNLNYNFNAGEKKSEPTSIQKHAQNKLCTLCTMLKRKKCELNALGMDKENSWQG